LEFWSEIRFLSKFEFFSNYAISPNKNVKNYILPRLISGATRQTIFKTRSLAKLFLEEMVPSMGSVYGPYCSRQTEASVKAAQINNASTDSIISKARREGRTKAFNLNSLLIKPVQRVTKYPLLLQQVTTPTGGAMKLYIYSAPTTHPQ